MAQTRMPIASENHAKKRNEPKMVFKKDSLIITNYFRTEYE